jgi:hypothetical protein
VTVIALFYEDRPDLGFKESQLVICLSRHRQAHTGYAKSEYVNRSYQMLYLCLSLGFHETD